MHKLVDYICDELEELERKAEKEGKLTMAEVQYMDTLAHAKKNLLKGEEMMEGSDYSMDDRMYRREPDMKMSMARGRGRNAKRDSMGRYSSRMNGMSYANDLANSIYEIMDELPDDVKRDAQKLVKKIESM